MVNCAKATFGVPDEDQGVATLPGSFYNNGAFPVRNGRGVQLNLEVHWSLVSANGMIDCFKCTSINGTNPACEDPFHNNYTSTLLERPCMGGRKGRNGLFPASACIKLSGTYGKEKQDNRFAKKETAQRHDPIRSARVRFAFTAKAQKSWELDQTTFLLWWKTFQCLSNFAGF